MNAAKALLAIKGSDKIDFDSLSHGVSSDRKQWGNSSNIKNVEVIFTGSGVLYELSKYFGEEACKTTHTVYDLMYNIPCIHRAFSITYNCMELFIPIRDIKFIVDSDISKGWVQFQVDERYANGNSTKYVPRQNSEWGNRLKANEEFFIMNALLSDISTGQKFFVELKEFHKGAGHKHEEEQYGKWLDDKTTEIIGEYAAFRKMYVGREG